MVKIPDQFSVSSFDFGHPTPDGSLVKVRFGHLCSLWLPNVSDQLIVGGAVIGCS